MVPVVVLAVLAVVLIKTLMSVVAREEASTLPPWSPDYAAMTDPTVELRATTNDDVRAFLLPAVSEPAASETGASETGEIEEAGAEEQAGLNGQTRSPR
jgi:hypothetical protein